MVQHGATAVLPDALRLQLQHPFEKALLIPESSQQSPTTMPAYTLVVHLYAKDDAEMIKKLTAKLQEASQVYSNDKECLSW